MRGRGTRLGRVNRHRKSRLGAQIDRLVRGGRVDPDRVELALDNLHDLPLQRIEHTPLVSHCWELRDNLTIYDSAYVALAEALHAPLLTGDQRLARSTGPRCTIEVIQTSH